MSEGSQVSKVTICVKILKWRSLTHSVTKGRYRAARAAKNIVLLVASNIPYHRPLPKGEGCLQSLLLLPFPCSIATGDVKTMRRLWAEFKQTPLFSKLFHFQNTPHKTSPFSVSQLCCRVDAENTRPELEHFITFCIESFLGG